MYIFNGSVMMLSICWCCGVTASLLKKNDTYLLHNCQCCCSVSERNWSFTFSTVRHIICSNFLFFLSFRKAKSKKLPLAQTNKSSPPSFFPDTSTESIVLFFKNPPSAWKPKDDEWEVNHFTCSVSHIVESMWLLHCTTLSVASTRLILWNQWG